MTDEEYPFQDAIPATQVPSAWPGIGTDHRHPGFGPSGITELSHVQADRWGHAHGDVPLYSTESSIWEHGSAPRHGADDAGQLHADGGSEEWQSETTVHPDGDYSMWSSPAAARPSEWEAVPHAGSGSFLDVPALQEPDHSPDRQPSPGEFDTFLTADGIDRGPADAPQPEGSRDAQRVDALTPAPRRADLRTRRASTRRSAFFSVTAPSVAFLGISGFAAVSVGLGDPTGETVQAGADATPAAAPPSPGIAVDARLNQLPEDARDFADRVSRTQERLDLEQRRLEEQERRREEAARKKAEAARQEALRPKFALPVAQRGVGELFGAAGSMWSNRHTGLDFPVPMNTPVMAVTDGTVQTKWHQFYGNMVIVTAPDGTQTWYCHLASARTRSGHVKAGQVIAYAGSSGNSSGPHLHLEVRPGGGAPVDPLTWLRNHGLDPT
ncbi:M23 family metallopeptidase [Streptomyces sp. NPDC048405]|uniref:M23 family metallopeptidase n=1 Tax=Streptomyces TaxID=1883 RepID=UPI001FCFAE2C|nr:MULTISPECIES: M23 family metallopeptidase [Streptomyces]